MVLSGAFVAGSTLGSSLVVGASLQASIQFERLSGAIRGESLDAGRGEVIALAAPIQSRYIVVLRNGSDASRVARDHARLFGINAIHVYRNVFAGYAALMDPSQRSAIEGRPEVLFLDLDLDERPPSLWTAASTPEQPAQVPGFTIGRIDADESTTIAGDGKGSVNVNVAVLDTGVQPDHPDLNVVNGYSCVGGTDPKAWADGPGHGTMVAGFIAARDNKIGRLGVAPGARISAVRVLDVDGFGWDSELICGMDWVAGTRRDGASDNDIAIANMSLGTTGTDDGACGAIAHNATHAAICGLTRLGVTVVASAGNDSADFQFQEPAAFGEVLAVTAMADRDGQPGGLGGQFVCEPSEVDDTPATFTNFATVPHDRSHVVSAPGVCIASTFPGSTYGLGSGTSFAAPIASGVVALCLAYGPCAGLTPAQIVARIVSDAEEYNQANPTYGFEGDPLRPDGGRYFGYLINAGLY